MSLISIFRDRLNCSDPWQVCEEIIEPRFFLIKVWTLHSVPDTTRSEIESTIRANVLGRNHCAFHWSHDWLGREPSRPSLRDTHLAALPTKGERRNVKGWIDEWTGTSWRAVGYVGAPVAASPADLDAWVGLSAHSDVAPSTDPFGAAVRAAQALPEPEPQPRYVPDTFTGPDFDRDAAYRRAMGGGS